MNKTLNRSCTSCLRGASVLVSLLVASTLPGLAADKTWDGGGSDNNWLTGANWTDDVAPVANDSLFFDGSLRLTPNNNFSAGTIFQNLTFNPSADVFTLGGNALTIPNPAAAAYAAGLNAPYLGGSISNVSFNTETINLPITLANGHHNILGNLVGGALNLSAPITLGSGASATFSTGVNVAGSGLANVNGILGGWATMNPPTDWAALDDGNNVVAYTGYTDITAGSAIASAAASNVRITDGGVNVTLAGGAGTKDINTLHFGSGSSVNQIVDVAATQILRFGAKGGIFNVSRTATGTSHVLTIGTAAGVGLVTAGGADNTPGDLYLIETPFIGNTGNQVVMNSRITNNGTAAVTVHTFGHISYPNPNTYSGGTYIHGGRIQANLNTLGFGPVYVYPGGQLFLNSSGTYTNAVFIAGLGNAESVGNGAIRMGGRTLSGPITLMADAATANGTISGVISGPGGLIVGAGSGNGVGTLTIGSATGPNTYTGDTTINASNATATSTLTFASGRNNVMPHGAGKGNLNSYGATVLATFNLAGTSQTINGLNSIGSAANNIVTNGTTATVSTFTLGDGDANGSFGGIIASGVGSIALTKIGSGTQTLTGPNTYSNATTVSGGSLVFGAPGSFPASAGAVTVNSNATLDVSGAGSITLIPSSSLTTSNGTTVVALPAGGNAITTPTLNSLGATNYIGITSIPGISSYPAQFVCIKYTTLGGSLNFGLAGSLPPSPSTPFGGYISNNVANGSVDLVVTTGPTSIKWVGYSGGSPNSSWDSSTPNWATFGGAPTTYTDGNFVRFDDSASNGVVSLDQSVNPAGLTVTNNSLAYTFVGNNNITGNSGLSKQGSGSLTLDNTGFNNFSGGVVIGAGTLKIGNNDSAGNLPTTSSVVDNGTLVFARADFVTVPNFISGTGTVAQNGSGTLMLTAANTFTGAVTVVQGTLQTGNNSALGTTNGGTTVGSGATLDIGANAINLGQEVVTVSGSGVGGQGALINSSGNLTFVGPNMARLVMAGDTVVGGSGRFDLRSATTSNPGLGSLSTGGQPYKITKVGSGTFGLIGITVDPQLGDIEIQQGVFSTEAAMTTLGKAASNVIVWPGATFQMFAATNFINKVFTIGGDGISTNISATSGANNIIGPMAITNDAIFNVNNAVTLTLSNVITGPGRITKVGAGLLTFAGNSPNYAGGLQINSGTAAVSGTLSNSLGVNVTFGKFAVNGALLGTGGMTNTVISSIAGSGTAGGVADISGNLFPGDTNVVGTLTVGGLIAESGSTLYFDLGFNTTPGAGNDLVQVNGDLILNSGTITINPLALLKKAPAFSYRLINYTGALVTNSIPSVTMPQNYVGTLDFSTTNQVNLLVTGGPAVWDGGSASDSNWSDAANWGNVAISSGNSLFFGGNVRVNNNNDTAAGTTYQDLSFNVDAGPFVLNGNDLNLAGNIINTSTNTQTFLIPMSASAANTTFNGGTNSGTAKLIVGAGWTNTSGGLTTNTLVGVGIWTNLLFTPNAGSNALTLTDTAANWTLMDNGSSSPMTLPAQLDMQQGTFSFGQGASAPVLTNTSLINSRLGVLTNGVATFNMNNGSLSIAARLNTGTAAGAVAVLNQAGGTLTIGDVLQISDGAAGASSTVNVSGGILNVGTPGGNSLFLCSRGTGFFNVTISGLVRCGTFDVSRNIGPTYGKVNIDGGRIEVNRFGTATSASTGVAGAVAILNFNGGTVAARQNNATFIQGATTCPITCMVRSGGAIINDNGFAISILEPLQHDTNAAAPPTDGGLTKLGAGTLTLTAANTYTGPTAISNGTLAVNGSLVAASAVTVATNGTLAGTGNIGGSVTVAGGGSIAPAGAGAVGTLTVSNNITFQPNSFAAMELNKATAGNDLLRAIAPTATTINFNGTLSVSNLAGTLADGDSFKLFSATNFNGTFTSIQPLQPAIGLKWDITQLYTAGILRVTAVPTPGITNVSFSSGNIIIGGTNGTAGLSYRVLTSPDVTIPTSAWTILGTNAFNGSGNFQFSIGATNAMQFFRMQAL